MARHALAKPPPDPSTPPAWLDSMCLPRLAVKPTAEVGYQLSAGAKVVGREAPKALGIILLILFSPLIAALFTVVGIIAVVALLFPAGRRKWRAGIARWRNPLRIEIDREHLAPGETGSGTVFLKKTGDMRALRICLVCEESASYTRGTDRYTDKHRTVDEVLLSTEGDSAPGIDAPSPFAGAGPARFDFSFTIPPGAMHSFAARNNSLHWYVEVRRAYPGASEIKEPFGLMVYPLDVCARLLGAA